MPDLMLFKVALLPDDLGVVARSLVERFAVLLDVFCFNKSLMSLSGTPQCGREGGREEGESDPFRVYLADPQ